MKRLLFFLLCLATYCDASAQVARGNYGTIQPYTPATGAIYGYVLGVVTAKAIDTLTNVDTGLVRWTLNNNYDKVVDYTFTKISGTAAGTVLLQGSTDNINWNTLTGNTTYCAGCQGASATVTNTTGTKHYQWYLPHSTTGYKYMQLQTITSGTVTGTYAGTITYSY